VHISGYVLVDATQQTDQRTSQMVYLFFAEALTTGPGLPSCRNVPHTDRPADDGLFTNSLFRAELWYGLDYAGFKK